MQYCVITGTKFGYNEANQMLTETAIGLFVGFPPKEEVEKMEKPSELVFVKYSVFDVGEVFLFDGNREIGYPQRKPSKWGVTFDVFDNPDEAVVRAREVVCDNAVSG